MHRIDPVVLAIEKEQTRMHFCGGCICFLLGRRRRGRGIARACVGLVGEDQRAAGGNFGRDLAGLGVAGVASLERVGHRLLQLEKERRGAHVACV